MAGRVLADLGVTYEALKVEVIGIVGTPAEHEPRQIIPTSRVKRVIEMAFQEATNAGAEFVGTQHLLAALLVEAEGVAPLALDQLGVPLPRSGAPSAPASRTAWPRSGRHRPTTSGPRAPWRSR